MITRITANPRFLKRLIDGFIDSPKLHSLINFKIIKFNARHIYPFSASKYTTVYAGTQPMLRMMKIANKDS